MAATNEAALAERRRRAVDPAWVMLRLLNHRELCASGVGSTWGIGMPLGTALSIGAASLPKRTGMLISFGWVLWKGEQISTIGAETKAVSTRSICSEWIEKN